MRIAVLGSAGQIGKPLCKFLRDAGHNVVEIDIVNGYEHDLRDKTSQFSAKSVARWLDLLRESEFCYHLAFDVGGSTYLQKYQNTTEFIENNLKIMENTFDILHSRKIPYVFASSQMALDINSPYGVLKRIGEFRVMADPNRLGKVARFWNVFGPETDQAKYHVITDFVRAALRTQEIHIKTKGNERRQFLWVDDCCAGLELIRSAPGRTYDLSSYEWTSIYNLSLIVANRVREKIGKDVKIFQGEETSIQGVAYDPDEILKRLGFFPKVTLQNGIDNIIAYEHAQLLATTLGPTYS